MIKIYYNDSASQAKKLSNEAKDRFFQQTRELFYGMKDFACVKNIYSRFGCLAKSGYAEAITYLGIMHKYGYRKNKSGIYTVQLFEDAIRIGGSTLHSSLAYYELGDIILKGEVDGFKIKRDLLKARVLFEKAVEKDGDELAQKCLDRINEILKKDWPI